MQIEIPVNVQKIINTLEENGYEAYAVGGCIRDSVLGRTPNDWDITTSALPNQTKALFAHTFDTGIKHGTISVLLGKTVYEVTTYRIDGEYEDSRHPKDVVFTPDLKEDLRRRDFTINAMAYNPKVGLVDIFGGLEDLRNHMIRAVGNAEERFTEDALRILRAVRFAAQLGFDIDDGTKAAIRKLAPNLSHISAERICAELLKLLESDHPMLLRTAWELGITKIVLPEFDTMMDTVQNNPHHCYTVGEHTLRVIEGVRPDRVLRLSALLHDVGKPACRTTDEDGIDHFHHHPAVGKEMAVGIMKRLKLDNDTIAKVSRLVCYHDYKPEPNAHSMRRAINKIGEDAFPDIFELILADINGQSKFEYEAKLEYRQKIMDIYREIMDSHQCLSIKSLAITGRDLIEMGIEPGPALGRMLDDVLEKVLETPELNTRQQLLDYVKGLSSDEKC